MKAKMFYKTFQKITITVVVVNSAIIYIFQEQIFNIFTNNEEIKSLLRSLIYLICLLHVPDAYKGMMRGLMKALIL